MVPQIINIYFRGMGTQAQLPDYCVVIQYIMYILCGATQFFFLTFEYAELKYSGAKDYLGSGWNYMDST